MNKNKILIQLSESPNSNFGKEDFLAQSEPQKVFSAIWEAEGRVNMDGFQFWFLNGPDESIYFVVEAFKTIGAMNPADVSGRAIAAAFPNGLPTDLGEIPKAAEQFSEETVAALNSLDQEFMTCPENVTNLLFDFVSKHPEEFGTMPKPDDA